MKHQRAKNLDDQAVAGIVGILDGWSGKLTWDLLLDAIHRHMRERYTRQALHNHARIAQAFNLRKAALTEAAFGRPRQTKANSSPEMEAAQQRINKLEAENQRLTFENNRLLDQFVRWAYNAYTRGLAKSFLDEPLPTVNRDQTKVNVNGQTGGRR